MLSFRREAEATTEILNVGWCISLHYSNPIWFGIVGPGMLVYPLDLRIFLCFGFYRNRFRSILPQLPSFFGYITWWTSWGEILFCGLQERQHKRRLEHIAPWMKKLSNFPTNSMVPNGQVRKGNFHKRARFFPQKVNYIIILGAWWDWIVKTPLDQIILPIKTSKLTLLVSENDHLLKVLAMNFWEKNPPATLLHTKSHATPLDRGWCSWRFATRWYRV